jgi:hypothetical protein
LHGWQNLITECSKATPTPQLSYWKSLRRTSKCRCWCRWRRFISQRCEPPKRLFGGINRFEGGKKGAIERATQRCASFLSDQSERRTRKQHWKERNFHWSDWVTPANPQWESRRTSQNTVRNGERKAINWECRWTDGQC